MTRERAIAAEMVALAALLLALNPTVDLALNVAALAADNTNEAHQALLIQLAEIRADPTSAHAALAAWEALDAALRAWRPHQHPIGAPTQGALL